MQVWPFIYFVFIQLLLQIIQCSIYVLQFLNEITRKPYKGYRMLLLFKRCLLAITSECPWCNKISADAFLTLHIPAITQTKQKNKQTQYNNSASSTKIIYQFFSKAMAGKNHFIYDLCCQLQIYVSLDTSFLVVADHNAYALLHCREHSATTFLH